MPGNEPEQIGRGVASLLLRAMLVGSGPRVRSNGSSRQQVTRMVLLGLAATTLAAGADVTCPTFTGRVEGIVLKMSKGSVWKLHVIAGKKSSTDFTLQEHCPFPRGEDIRIWAPRPQGVASITFKMATTDAKAFSRDCPGGNKSCVIPLPSNGTWSEVWAALYTIFSKDPDKSTPAATGQGLNSPDDSVVLLANDSIASALDRFFTGASIGDYQIKFADRLNGGAAMVTFHWDGKNGKVATMANLKPGLYAVTADVSGDETAWMLLAQKEDEVKRIQGERDALKGTDWGTGNQLVRQAILRVYLANAAGQMK